MDNKPAKNAEYWKSQYQAAWGKLGDTLMDISEYCESPIEEIACYALVQLVPIYGMYNITIKPQRNVASYRVDFMVFHGDKKIVVECDGHEFHEKTKEQASLDKQKDRDLQKLGLIVLRYSGSDIVNNPSKITNDINDIIGRAEWDLPNEVK